jgi:YHYH protein
MFKPHCIQPVHLLVGLGLILIGCSVAVIATGNPLDPTRLPLGDGKIGSSAEVGRVFSCQTTFPPAGGAFKDGSWIKPDGSFDLTTKAVVDGSASWTSSQSITMDDTTNSITGNGLPNHTTGIFPVSLSDDAYQFDRNPNAIQAQTITYNLPTNPMVAAIPTCLGLGPIGITLTGAVFFNALDATGKDAVAHELQDACQGHPERTGQYHYHSLTSCLSDPGSGHSSLMGYALDGFGIYGKRGENGELLTNADLDACHGHTHEIVWNTKTVAMYHYHATDEYPYTLGCYRGTPILN